MMKRLTYMNPFSKASRYLLALLLLSSVSAFAQNATGDEDNLEEVQGFTVVGSNIQRLDMETVNPVINITRDALDATGFTTAGDAIRALPIISGSSLTTTDAGTSFTPGVSSFNLRGLGNNNTLALLNGRRLAPYPTPGFNGFQSVVDLSSIPSAAIESIQILKDGASAIYGSDAVAGVISINLTKQYDGLTTQMSIGNTLKTDSFEWGMFAIGGATSGKASIVYTVDYKVRNPLYAREVPWTKTADGRKHGGYDQRSSSNVSANVVGLDPTMYLIDPSGDPEDSNNQLFPSGTASLTGLPEHNAFGSLPAAGYIPTISDFKDGIQRYDFQEDTGLFPKTRNYGFYTRLSYALTDSLDAYAETSFRRAETTIAAAPTPAFFANEPVTMSADNPYNPFGVELTDVRWRMKEVGNRINDVTVDTPRIVAGLTGDVGETSWTFDSGILYTKTEATNSNRNDVFDDRLQEALSDGVTINDELLWANPFGRNDPRLINYISGPNPTSDSFELWTWDAKGSGDVADLGDMGVIKAAAGVEYRYEQLESYRTAANETGNIVGGSESSSVTGDRSVRSAYVEFDVPVYKYAEFQLAGRYEDYSDFGNTSKPKIGVKVKPFDGLLLRAAYSESFRAPDLPYLFSSGSVSFTSSSLQDPLRPNDPREQIKNRSGGNPNLQPERTNTYYAGAVVDFGKFVNKLDGLVFSIDLWRFAQKDVIQRLTADQILDNLIDPKTGEVDPFWAKYIKRNPPAPGESVGTISEVSTQWQNLDKQKTEGADMALQYSLATDNYGEFRFKVETTWVNSFTFTDAAAAQTYEWADTYLQPKWRGTGTIAWSYGDWDASLYVTYVDDYEDAYLSPQEIKAYWRFNPQVAYHGLYDTTITVGVRNVFNESPPFDSYDVTGVSTQLLGSDIEPRFVYMRIAKDW
jgi:outer membrane receptor protein involved in Fe transport